MRFFFPTSTTVITNEERSQTHTHRDETANRELRKKKIYVSIRLRMKAGQSSGIGSLRFSPAMNQMICTGFHPAKGDCLVINSLSKSQERVLDEFEIG